MLFFFYLKTQPEDPSKDEDPGIEKSVPGALLFVAHVLRVESAAGIHLLLGGKMVMK